MIKEVDIKTVFKTRRSELNMSQSQMAELLNVGRAAYSAWEEGRGRPRIDNILRMSQRLGYQSLDDFLMIKSEPGSVHSIVRAYLRLNPDQKKIVDFILKISQ
jgi:transcriptional regulator with XRE-family HTH domain